MAKISISFLILLISLQLSSQSCLEKVYTKEIGVRETSSNWGKDVSKYLKSVGWTKPAPWCAAFVHWCLEQCSIKNTVTAWSPSAESKYIVYKNRKLEETPQAGDVFTLYYLNLKRVGHTGFIHRSKEGLVETVEGNTSERGDRNGGMVCKRKRSIYTLHSISRWTD